MRLPWARSATANQLGHGLNLGRWDDDQLLVHHIVPEGTGPPDPLPNRFAQKCESGRLQRDKKLLDMRGIPREGGTGNTFARMGKMWRKSLLDSAKCHCIWTHS